MGVDMSKLTTSDTKCRFCYCDVQYAKKSSDGKTLYFKRYFDDSSGGFNKFRSGKDIFYIATWWFIDALKCKLQYKTRTGLGGSASSTNPCSLSFNFAPDIIWCIPAEGVYNDSSGKIAYLYTYNPYAYGAVKMSLITTSFQSTYFCANGTTVQAKKSSDGKTLYWYGEELAFNKSNYLYLFLGLA